MQFSFPHLTLKNRKSLDDLKMAERHSFIDPDQLMAEFENSFGKTLGKLEEAKDS